MYRHKEETADMKEGKKTWGYFPLFQNSLSWISDSKVQDFGFHSQKTSWISVPKSKSVPEILVEKLINGMIRSVWKFFGQSGSPPEVVLGFDWSVQSDRNLAFHFQNWNPSWLSSNQNFGRNANGSLRFDCFNRTMLFVFSWLFHWYVTVWFGKMEITLGLHRGKKGAKRSHVE